jgi:hypothetical protein
VTDAAGDVWVLNSTGVTELPVGNYDAGQTNYTPGGFDCNAGVGTGYNCPIGIAVDGARSLWIVADASLNVVELPAANYSQALSFPVPGLSYEFLSSIAIDQAGNVWAANLESSTISELVGLAKPVMTPLQTCLALETSNPGQDCVP